MKRPTNEQFVVAIMRDLGPLAQIMVIDAIDKLTKQLAAAPPIEHGLINGQTYKAIAEEIQRRMEARSST